MSHDRVGAVKCAVGAFQGFVANVACGFQCFKPVFIDKNVLRSAEVAIVRSH